MRSDRSRLVPLLGVLFVVVLIVGFATGGESPSVSDDSAKDIVDFYVDNKTSVTIGSALEALAGLIFVFFAGYLSRFLRTAEGERGFLSTLVLAGAVVVAVGLAIDATINLALAQSAEDIAPTGAQALMALYNYDFVPIAMGIQIFLVATGISLLLHGALPRWLGWFALLFAVVGLTPVGWAAGIGGALLILIISVMLAMGRGGSAGTPAAPAAG